MQGLWAHSTPRSLTKTVPTSTIMGAKANSNPQLTEIYCSSGTFLAAKSERGDAGKLCWLVCALVDL